MLTQKPLIVTFFGGPGTGKSTTAALVFGQLKQEGVNAELVTEYAKELVYEEHGHKLAYQPYVCVKQLWRIERLRESHVIVTDTSPLLGAIYGKMHKTFMQWLIEDHRMRNTLDIFLTRDESRVYNPVGRQQDEAEALAADTKISELLRSLQIQASTLAVDKMTNKHVSEACAMIRAIENERH